ncbi:MAG: DUF4266 domain-containing protein [Deltaproteobacteria bacterium]|nr:DUF4266 domain-containing protein [bacterium]MCB9475382.1 DUF4266 domain-containing protein [Deltaproteobacteria bacterium]MCB9478458.1 DUF4266 domain-containing protein [Deltaproteobacteria bacterium]MCB9489957.1 DUF4266 domain-containing protein [Deltaproteobacteria bacterium]
MALHPRFFVRVGFAVLIFSLVSWALPGCVVVQPYDRAALADPIMQFDAFGVDSAYHDKMYATREAARGGSGGASGGCACK